jgi:hypothetical protein
MGLFATACALSSGVFTADFHSLPVALLVALSHEISKCRRSEVNKVINLQSVDILCVRCRHHSALFVAFFSFTLNTFNITAAGWFQIIRSVSVSVGHTDIIVCRVVDVVLLLRIGRLKFENAKVILE